MTFVRQAVLADLDELALFDEWSGATEGPIRAAECYVAGHDESVQAYGIFDRSFFKRPFIATIFVHRDHRRGGLGTALIRHIETLVDGEKLWISTNIENLAMQRTLHGLEYELSGVVNNLGKCPELIYFKLLESRVRKPPVAE